MNQKIPFNSQRIIPLILLLLLLTPLSLVMAQEQLSEAISVTGTYSGSVTIDQPAPLGALDLVISITDNGGKLSGQVNAAKTQVFLGGPTFSGTVSNSQGISPTFRIDSQLFTGQVSGRTVQRQFTITGMVADQANTLRGQYTETITGFTPKPLLVKGRFSLVRPSGSRVILPEVTPTPTVTGVPNTPTRTPTATPPGTGDSSHSLYLPIVSKNR
ncbi:MAG: hypothetical protein U0175_33475 [Caldilineaceae bacterium]